MVISLNIFKIFLKRLLTFCVINGKLKMIDLLRLDGKIYWVNLHMIEAMETTPDLTLTMLSGRKIIVRNSPQEVIQKIIEYRRQIGIDKQEVL